MITLTQNSNLNPTEYCLLQDQKNTFLSPDHHFQAKILRSCPLPHQVQAVNIMISAVSSPKILSPKWDKSFIVRPWMVGESPLIPQLVKFCNLKQVKNSSLLDEGHIFFKLYQLILQQTVDLVFTVTESKQREPSGWLTPKQLLFSVLLKQQEERHTLGE